MSHHHLSNIAEVRPLTIDGSNYVLAAGTSDVNSTSVDMLGYEGVAFLLLAGTIAGSGSVATKVQQSDDDGSTDDFTDVAGTSSGTSADTDDNKAFITDIYRPGKRYVRLVTTRGDGGNSTINALVALLYKPGQAAVTQAANVFATKKLNHPAEGTA